MPGLLEEIQARAIVTYGEILADETLETAELDTEDLGDAQRPRDCGNRK